jgi:hypothetical protein
MKVKELIKLLQENLKVNGDMEVLVPSAFDNIEREIYIDDKLDEIQKKELS